LATDILSPRSQSFLLLSTDLDVTIREPLAVDDRMKFYPAENLGYFDTVQAFFLELTGRGMTLSGRDVELLLRWRDEGASAAIICQGIDRAVSSMAERPRDIWACRRHIEPLVEKARKASAGGHREPEPAREPVTRDSYATTVLEQAVEIIERCGEAARLEQFKAVYRAAWKRLHEIDPEDALAEVAQLEDELARDFFEALDSSEQKAVDSEIRETQGAYLKNMSSNARSQHLAAHRKRILGERYDFPSLL